MKQRTKLQLRKIQQEKSEAQIRFAFEKARVEEKNNAISRTKRRDHSDLDRYLARAALCQGSVRPVEQYRSRSYNLARQVLSYIDHRFVLYKTPMFLYRAALSPAGLRLVFGDLYTPRQIEANGSAESGYLPWFLTVAQGGSLARLAKGDLTKREVHVLLQAPDDLTIDQCVIWTRFVVAGMPTSGARFVLDRLRENDFAALGSRLTDFVLLYSRMWPEMSKTEREEITDYLRVMAHDQEFSFKGRTLGSIRKFSFDWHRRSYGMKVHQRRVWDIRFPVWKKHVDKDLVFAVELTTNTELAEEGSAQRHCVFLYADQCQAGRASIVSLRWNAPGGKADKRLTVEIRPTHRTIVQIRGKLNRIPTSDEMNVVRHWAGDLGLSVVR